LFDEDLDMLRVAGAALQFGLPEEALVQLVRVYADALGRVADAESRLFHFYVHERLRAEGLESDALTAATDEALTPLIEIIDPTVLFFHRRALRQAVYEDLVLHLAQDTAPPGTAVAELPVAVLFVDLASFTPLTETMGDTEAARVLDRFSELVREAAASGDGRVIKQIGDEFMLVFPSAAKVVECGLGIADRAATEPHFPAVRLGAHIGTALYREADYLGATVNTAARIAGQAQRGEFLVSSAVRDRAADLRGISWRSCGARPLKGITEPVEIFEPSRGADRPPRLTDPVCGMEILPDHADITLTYNERDFHFCSEACPERFVAAPDQYSPG